MDIKSLFTKSEPTKWTITVNGEPLGYVETRNEADLLLTTVTKKLLAKTVSGKLEILDAYTRRILEPNKRIKYVYEKLETVYTIKLHEISEITKLVDFRRISQLKHNNDSIDNPIVRFTKKFKSSMSNSLD